MYKYLLSIVLILFSLPTICGGQACEVTEVNATPLACDGNYFLVTVDLEVSNPASPGFTLAGNGVIYGTFLYTDLPVTVGPLLGDNESVYEFIAWDVENEDCQNYTTLESPDCGPVCGFSNAVLELIQCNQSNSNIASVDLDFDHEGTTNPAFDVFYENGSEVGSWLYESLPVNIQFLQLNGADPIVLTICDNLNPDCCETFVLDAIDCNPDNCEIYNVNVDPECTGANFLVHLDFDYVNVSSDSFTVNGNNLNYGTFGYNELPITLGPLNGGTTINWEFIIRDSELTTCVEEYVLGVYNCPPPCDVQALAVDPGFCANDSSFSLLISLEIEGEGDLGYSVFSDNAYYGTFQYDDLPLSIPEYEDEFLALVTVCDNENLGCCATAEFEGFNCAGCVIANLEAIPVPCNDQNQIYVILDFDFTNESPDGFNVSGNGENFGDYSYDSVPVSIGPFPGDSSVYLEFVVTDLVDDFCFDATEIGLLACGDICELSNLVVETGDCTGNNTYVVHVDFDFENTQGVGFDLYANGEFFDYYNYSELPITIEEFPSNAGNTDTIQVCDNDDPNCCATIVFESENCPCQLFELTTQTLECTSDSTFAIEAEFFYENLPGNFVDVFFDDIFIGFYSVNDIPLLIPNIPEGDGFGILSICANDLPTCCVAIAVELDTCESAQCLIWDLFAEVGDCTSDTTFILHVSFNYSSLPTDSVDIYANDLYIGRFLATPDFINIPNFPVLGNDTHLNVCAAGAPDCCDDFTFETPDCIPGCEIWDLVADPGPCNSDSTYHLVIEYNSEDLPGDSVILTANGNFIGQFPANPEHIVIENFPVYDANQTTITLCAVGAPDCCDSFEFETPGCNDCHLFDLFVEVGDCTSDSTYILEVHFTFDNLPTDSVIITANETNIGTFHVSEGQILIENFPVFDANETVIHVCAQEAPDCCDFFEFETPECTPGGCEIWDLVADAGDCLTDSTYTLLIEYNGEDVPGDSVTVTANGNFIGTFEDPDHHIVIEHFPWFDGDIAVLTLCSVAFPDCCDSYEFEIPNCPEGDPCHIFDLFVEIGNCQSDSTYVLVVDFQFDNLPTDSVVITANEENIGTFHVSEGHFILENFPLFQSDQTTVHVCAQGAPDCCDVVEFQTPFCDSLCHVYNLFAEIGDCTSDTTFVLDIVFDHVNNPTDSVLIHANDLFLGTFNNNLDFIHIENFPLLDGETTTITVCAQGAPDCCDTYTFENPNCGPECSIFDASVVVLDCTSDSTFGVVVNFDWENVDTGGFDLYAGDFYLGFFTFDQIPAEIPAFPANNTGEYVVIICESDGFECCTGLAFEGPVCQPGSCDLFGLEWSVTPCDSAGNFFFILDFNFLNVGAEGFSVHGNGNNYGTFNYQDVPIELGPFESNNTFYEFQVTDNQFGDCSDSVVPGDVECFVATEDIGHDEVFEVFNNGSLPGVFVKKDLTLSLYNSNGKMLVETKMLTEGTFFELNSVPSGIYIATIVYEGNLWPVKLVKGSY